MLPADAMEMTTAVAMTRSVAWNTVSPMAESGPMRAVLMPVMVEVSKSGSWAFCSSMARTTPSGRPPTYGVTLKYSLMWRV